MPPPSLDSPSPKQLRCLTVPALGAHLAPSELEPGSIYLFFVPVWQGLGYDFRGYDLTSLPKGYKLVRSIGFPGNRENPSWR